MTRARIEEAVKEAKRFIARADNLRNKLLKDANSRGLHDDLWGSPETAAVKRASLDLTRALAAMRRSSSFEERNVRTIRPQ